MEQDTIDAIAKAIVKELYKEGFVSRRALRPVLSKDEQETAQTEIYKENEKRIKELIKEGEFLKEKYDFPEEGPYDWRYVINKGKGLTATKYMLALYWLEKRKCTVPGWSRYAFNNKQRAGMVITMELADAKKLAGAIPFKEFPELVRRADARAYDEAKEDYKWEWKLTTLIKQLKND